MVYLLRRDMLIYIDEEIFKLHYGNAVSTYIVDTKCFVQISFPCKLRIFLFSEKGFDVVIDKKVDVLVIGVNEDHQRAYIRVDLDFDITYLLNNPEIYVSFDKNKSYICLSLVPLEDRSYKLYDTKEMLI